MLHVQTKHTNTLPYCSKKELSHDRCTLPKIYTSKRFCRSKESIIFPPITVRQIQFWSVLKNKFVISRPNITSRGSMLLYQIQRESRITLLHYLYYTYTTWLHWVHFCSTNLTTTRYHAVIRRSIYQKRQTITSADVARIKAAFHFPFGNYL